MKIHFNQYLNLLILFLTLNCSNIQAQVHHQLSLDRLNSRDIGSDIIELDNGDLLLIGSTDNAIENNSLRDGILTRINPNTGAIIWSRAYGIDGNTDNNALSMAIQTNNGDIVAVGFITDADDTDQSMWFLRVNSNTGAVLASTSFNESGFSFLINVFESPNPAGGTSFIAVGGTGVGTFDNAYITRLDAGGNILQEFEYSGNANWFTEAIEINNAIYACGGFNGGANGRPLIVEFNPVNLAVNNAWSLDNGRILNCLQTVQIGTDQHLTLGGITQNEQPLFVDFNITDTVIDQAIEYPIEARITSIQRNPQGGWLANFRALNQMEFALLDDDGNIDNFITYNDREEWINRLTPLSNNRIATIGWNDDNNDSPLILNIVGNNGESGCSVFNQLQETPINANLNNLVVPNNIANSTATNVTLNTVNLNWEVTTNCEGCWTSLDSGYIRLDSNNPDARIADFGIVDLGNNRFRIRNGLYNRLPEKLYLANGVLLDIEAINNGVTNTIVDLTDSDVVFGVGAGIRVQTGAGQLGNRAELIINEATLRPCLDGNTWDGIVVSGARASLTCQASTFINATLAIYVEDAADGIYANNSFLNCQFGIVGNQAAWNSPITSNIFSINATVLGLDYTPLDEIETSDLNVTANIWGNANRFSTINNRYFNGNGNPILTAANFQGFAAIELMGSTNGNLISNSVISQNQFINSLPLGDDHPEYNGILLDLIHGINISQNRFTNNDRSIIINQSLNNSIENNYMEVTRRSTADRSFYQIVVSAASTISNSASALLIKENTLVNSAAPLDLTPDIISTDNQPSNEVLNGTGAIYIHGSTNAPIRIANNTITGFEIGIYKLGGHNSQIVKNHIQAHLIGIFQDRGNGLIGCNEINMDALANNISVAGISGEQSTLSGLSTILSNCIQNTDRAINLIDNRNKTIENLKWRIINNHFYNYSEAGIFLEDITNVSSVALGLHQRIRRNAFLANTGGTDIFLSSPINNPLRVRIDDNHVGADGVLNVTNATGNTQSGIFHGPTSGYVDWNSPLINHLDLRPFAACAGMDATNQPLDPVIEEGWATNCDDETFGDVTAPLLARTTTGQLQLVSNYATLLNVYTDKEAADIISLTLTKLEDPISLTTLFQTAQQLEIDQNTQQWLAVRYYLQLKDWASAQQVVQNIIPITEEEEEHLNIQKAQINTLSGQPNSANLLTELKLIANKHGFHKHAARSILNVSTNQGYSFEYNPIKIAAKITSANIIDTYDDAHHSIQIAPNPAHQYINVNISTQTDKQWSTIALYDIHGRLLKKQSITSYQETMDVETLSQGVYIITLKDPQGTAVSQKFIKN